MTVGLEPDTRDELSGRKLLAVASPISWLSQEDHARAVAGEDWLFDTVGLHLPGVEARIHEPADDGVGEIWARAGHLSTVDGEGWLATGDMGSLTEGGYLRRRPERGDDHSGQRERVSHRG